MRLYQTDVTIVIQSSMFLPPALNVSKAASWHASEMPQGEFFGCLASLDCAVSC
jgi:hypothetical protein